MTFLTAAGLFAAALIVTPLSVLGAECLMACLPLRRRKDRDGGRPSIAVLVPAHNEEAGLAATLESIRPDLTDDDQLLVIADNCDDGTAEVAAAHGAEVLVRTDAERRGKGYAIRHALDHVAPAPPEVIVSIDADCVASPGSIETIARVASESNRPVQAAYLMDSPPDAESRGVSRISEFAVLVKNYVRPRGLQAAGLPCLLTGSGIAYPWEALERTPHPGANIVEDMTYAVDLAINGYAPKPCMEARFVATLPSRDSAFTTQRTRWEHGHLATIASQSPRLLWAFLRSGRLSLLAMLLELSTPPLSLLVVGAASVAIALVAAAIAGAGLAPLAVVAVGVMLAGCGLFVAWLRFGRDVLPWHVALAIPGYVITKLPLYQRFFVKPEATWVRTERDTPPAPHFTDRDGSAVSGTARDSSATPSA